MMATLTQTSPHSFAMAEDDMEISSEHGRDAGDEDIDIDIDFTAAHPDEDHILEDIASHEDVEVEFQLSQSPNAIPDEVMVDEDDQSFQMDDADLLLDEDAQTVDNEPVSYGAEGLEYPEDYSNTKTEENKYQETLEGRNLDAQELEFPIDTNSGDPETHEPNEQNPPSLPPLATESPNFAQITQPHAAQNSPTTLTTNDHSTLEAPVIENLQSSPVVAHKFDESLSGTEANIIPTGSAEQDLQAESETAVQLEISDTSDSLLQLPDFIVSWDGKEYPLFSTSDSDDPNTYFLSDPSILDKPLAIFFEAIRQVVHEDLSDEDELVLSIDDLGLETSEVGDTGVNLETYPLSHSRQASISVKDVSLSQIVDVRQQLLRNDGSNETSEASASFHISITLKKNFSKRLSNLIVGAAEGKRLYEFWDAESQSLNELEGELKNQYEHESAEASLSSNSIVEGEGNQHSEEVDETANDPYDQTELRQGSQSPPATGAANEPEAVKVNLTLEGDLDQAASSGRAPELEEPDADKGFEGAVDDDGDFIDYSEDELESEHGQKDMSVPKAVNDRQDKDYDQINEELRRRSLSRRLEDEPSTLAEDQTNSNIGIGSMGGDGQIDIAHEEVTDEDLHTGESGHQEVLSADDFQEEHVDYSATYDDDLNGAKTFSGDETGYEHEDSKEEYVQQFDQVDPSEDELGFEDDDSPGTPSQVYDESIPVNAGDPPDESRAGEASDRTGDSAVGSHIFPDTAESSVTLGADDIYFEEGQENEVVDGSIQLSAELLKEESEVGSVEQKDEIDYEDDEDEVEQGIQVADSGHPPAEMKALSPAKGKRTIAEVNTDGLEDAGSDAKRLRS